MGWEEIKDLELDPSQQLSIKKGYKQFVANRGDVSFYFPRKWIDIPNEEGLMIQFYDKRPPRFNCMLSVSTVKLAPHMMDALPLIEQLEAVIEREMSIFEVVAKGGMFREPRDDFDLAWAELCLVDPDKNRNFISRYCIAQSTRVQAFIVFKFWASRVRRFDPIWEEIRHSIMLERYIKVRIKR